MSTTNQFFWYELMTSDHAAAQRFYADVVGWKLSPFPADGHPYTVLEVAGGRGTGGIMPMPPEAAANGMHPAWVGYVHVANLDAAVAKLKAGGGTLHHVLDPIPEVGHIAVVSDPQGAMFNLLQPDGPDADPMAMGTDGATDWHELHSSDWERGLAFYGEQFGWSKTDAMDMGPMGTYQMFAMEPGSRAEATRGGMLNDPQAPNPYWLFYFHVADIDAAVTRVKDNGGAILMGPQQVPGGIWIINGRDPQGAIFALAGHRAE
jgi:predicted enzyme related to lactoylglutathione lyase